MPRKTKTQTVDTPFPGRDTSPAQSAPSKSPNKLEALTELLVREGGASLAELCAATGWQSHSVRGALSGALKKRGLTISSSKTDGERRYAATKVEVDAQ